LATLKTKKVRNQLKVVKEVTDKNSKEILAVKTLQDEQKKELANLEKILNIELDMQAKSYEKIEAVEASDLENIPESNEKDN
jgi:hypothetical protein